jgi:cytochrome P450
MTDLDAVDFFKDQELVNDPYPYYEHMRAKCPVAKTDQYNGLVVVTGYDEVNEIFRDNDTFSSVNSTSGPFLPFADALEGDDVSEIIAANRDRVPGSLDMVTMDPPMHTRERSLLTRLMTPRRLKENEDFMRGLAHRLLDNIVDQGSCEFIKTFSQPFSMLAVADVLGVPEEHHETFREGFGLHDSQSNAMALGGGSEPPAGGYEGGTLWLDKWFTEYLEARRMAPQSDVLSDLALAKYPDGSTPDMQAIVRTATFLFAAGQETTARLLAVALKYLAEYPELQDQLREHPEGIRNFIEEALRIESPTKADSRLTRHATSSGGVDIPAGTTVVMMLGAANRDPRRFESPEEFRADRPNAKEQIAFGRGVHSCPGGPLARAEGAITVEAVLNRMRNIRLSDEHHGPATARHFEYEPTWVLHGLRNLYIEYDPA